MEGCVRLGGLVTHIIVALLCINEMGVTNAQLSNQKSEETFNTEMHDKKVVCYFGSWNVKGMGFNIENDLDPNICTHIIYAFATFDRSGTLVERDAGKIIIIYAIVGPRAIISTYTSSE